MMKQLFFITLAFVLVFSSVLFYFFVRFDSLLPDAQTKVTLVTNEITSADSLTPLLANSGGDELAVISSTTEDGLIETPVADNPVSIIITENSPSIFKSGIIELTISAFLLSGTAIYFIRDYLSRSRAKKRSVLYRGLYFSGYIFLLALLLSPIVYFIYTRYYLPRITPVPIPVPVVGGHHLVLRQNFNSALIFSIATLAFIVIGRQIRPISPLVLPVSVPLFLLSDFYLLSYVLSSPILVILFIAIIVCTIIGSYLNHAVAIFIFVYAIVTRIPAAIIYFVAWCINTVANWFGWVRWLFNTIGTFAPGLQNPYLYIGLLFFGLYMAFSTILSPFYYMYRVASTIFYLFYNHFIASTIVTVGFGLIYLGLAYPNTIWNVIYILPNYMAFVNRFPVFFSIFDLASAFALAQFRPSV